MQTSRPHHERPCIPGIALRGLPKSVLHGFSEELRWCVQVVSAEQNGVLDAHGLAAPRGELRDDVLRGGVVRERGRAVVGLVEAIGRLDFVTGAEYDVGLEPADLPADVAA